MASPLDATTNELFESTLGIKGSTVSLEYIRKRRSECDYPIDHSAEYSGRNIEELEHLSPYEIQEALNAVDNLVARFGS